MANVCMMPENINEMLEDDSIVVVTDGIGYSQCMYRAGRRKVIDPTIYSCDIAEESGGKPVKLFHIVAEIPEEEEFPKNLKEIFKWPWT